MDVIISLEAITAKLDRIGRESVGLIMTKGALHEGHIALIKAARTENEYVIVSSFLHPQEFTCEEAYELYPRQQHQDIEVASRAGADFFFCPSYEGLYPNGSGTYVSIHTPLINRLEGEIHPKFYQSFLTTAHLLLSRIRPQRCYVGEKDFQKNTLLSQLIRDFHYACEIKVLPTKREDDGLIISSKNDLLEPEERKLAPILHHVLEKAKVAYERGNISSYKLKWLIETEVKRYYRIQLEYVEVLEVERLTSIETVLDEALITICIRLGRVRLVDYVHLESKK